MMDEQQHPDWVITFAYDAAADESALGAVEDALMDLDGTAAAAGPGRVTVTLHLPAAGPGEAVEAGVRLLAARWSPAAAGWREVGVDAVTEVEHERRAAGPTLPELVGASEVGTILGVSRQRVHQLREQPAFPAPLVEVAMGPLWDARAVEAFARAWSRRPGRPPLAVAQ